MIGVGFSLMQPMRHVSLISSQSWRQLREVSFNKCVPLRQPCSQETADCCSHTCCAVKLQTPDRSQLWDQCVTSSRSSESPKPWLTLPADAPRSMSSSQRGLLLPLPGVTAVQYSNALTEVRSERSRKCEITPLKQWSVSSWINVRTVKSHTDTVSFDTWCCCYALLWEPVRVL